MPLSVSTTDVIFIFFRAFAPPVMPRALSLEAAGDFDGPAARVTQVSSTPASVSGSSGDGTKLESDQVHIFSDEPLAVTPPALQVLHDVAAAPVLVTELRCTFRTQGPLQYL